MDETVVVMLDANEREHKIPVRTAVMAEFVKRKCFHSWGEHTGWVLVSPVIEGMPMKAEASAPPPPPSEGSEG